MPRLSIVNVIVWIVIITVRNHWKSKSSNDQSR